MVYSTPSEITQPAAVDQAAANAHAWVPGSPWRLRYRNYWDDPWLYLNSGCDLQFWSGSGFNPLRDSGASGGGNLATQGPTAKSRKEDWTVAEGTAAGSPRVLVRMFIYHYNSLYMFIYIYVWVYILYNVYRILCAGCWFVKQGMCTQLLSQDGRELGQSFPSYCLRFIGFVLRNRYDG